jgi:threonine aldolase
MHDIIDLRSDTVTKPTEEMRICMAQADVGDDIYGEDPTINHLQEYIADLFQKEAALFVPTGVMSNQIALAIHTKKGDEIIVESQSHLFHYETSAPSIISGVQMYCVPSQYGEIPLESISEAIRPPDYYFPTTSLVCFEQTHNRHGGTVLSLEYLQNVSEMLKEKEINFHCDGARIWNACAETGVSPHEYAKNFDTLSVCLSKGLGSPAGSVLLGNKKHIELARKWRKILGGGMRQSGILAAGGLYALQNHRKLLNNDHNNARLFAEMIASSGLCTIANSNHKVDTNIVIIECLQGIKPLDFIDECKKRHLIISMGRSNCVRAVFHFQVSTEQTIQAAHIAVEALQVLAH